MGPIDFHWMDKNTMEVNGYRQLFGYQHSSKYIILCLTEERVNYCRFFHLNQVVLWWNPLTSVAWKNTMKVNGYHQLFGYQHSSKYLILCLTEERVNYGGIFQLNKVVLWWNPLTSMIWNKNTMKVNGYHQRFGYQHSSKYLILCLTEEKVNYVKLFCDWTHWLP